jgi:hypothetical protein
MGKPKGMRINKAVTPSVRKAQELKKKAVGIAQGVARRDAFLRLWNQPLDVDDEMDPFEAYAASLPPRKSIRRGGTRKTTKRRKSRAKRRTRKR